MKMKKTVEKSKQTVWVLTMLTVMVVLSAYYLVTDPITPTQMATTKEITSPEKTTIDVNTEEVSKATDLTDEIGSNESDYFVSLKMDRNTMRTKQLDDYYMMMKSDLSEEAIANIQDKIDYLQSIEESELVLENLIIAEGYDDAVVLTKENGVDIMIQTNSMKKEDAVKIIKLVSDRLNIPAVNVHIKPVAFNK
ncbi:SpoIIIAH-like family protein [Tepidibacillus infernus]|nr:SpoIIIAH-like family protein [Tepidibacillus sp. HK-1]GBF11032.1 stage III sporulation protein AH [Tepidibacillus sp. HK-1]